MSVFIAEGKGGHQRLTPMSPTFFASVADYLECERPIDATTDRLFVVLKGPSRGMPLSSEGLDEVMAAARNRAGLAHGTCHELRHTCLTRLREAGMSLEALQAQAGHRSIASTQIYLHLGATGWPPSTALPRKRSTPGSRWRHFHERRIGVEAARTVRLGSGGRPPLWTTKREWDLDLARDRHPGGTARLDDEGIPGPDSRFVPAEHRRVGGPRPAGVRRPPHRDRPGVRLCGRRLAPPYRVVQARPGGAAGKSPGKPAAVATICHKLGMVRTFFERIIEWDYDDAPRKVPIFAGDFPKRDEPLPRFLNDPTAAKFMAALAEDPDHRRRLMVELLARTGMRVGELGALHDDAMFRLSGAFWLRIPVGKLHNDRNVPLHPVLVELIDDYRARRGPSPSGLLVVRNDGQPFDRRTIHRYVAAVARRAGTGHVHPHQLRHTLATQLINRGMSLEAIAELLGHRSPRMTLVYARISNDVVAEQYFRATQAVEATATPPRVDEETRLLARNHPRLLGNGRCTRPAQLDCSYQTICEGCGFFETGPEFLTILRRQKDNAVEQADFERTHVYQELIDGLTTDKPLGPANPPALPFHPD